MQTASKSYLHFVPYSNLLNWSVQYMLDTKFSYSEKYPLVEIGTFLKRNKTVVDIEDDKEYKRVTIKVNNGGVFLRDIVKGKNIGTKKQFIISEGQFLLSKIDARNGAFGVVPHEVDGAVITGNFWAFDVDYSIINPYFLSLITTTSEFIGFSDNSSNGTTNRHYLQENLFLAQKIPLPPLTEQTRMVENYDTKIRQAEGFEKDAKDLEESIELYLFDKLGITQIERKIEKKGKLYFISLKNIIQWGVEKNLSSQNGDILHSDKFRNVKLCEYAQVNPRTELKFSGKSEEMSFVPMECISGIFGEVIELKKGDKSQSKGYTKFQNEDLIWARITPCMQNGKSSVVRELQNGLGYGSTEFHVLRTTKKELIIDYLYLLLRTTAIRKNAVNYFTGSAGQQRVPKSYLENLSIPLPPILIQNEILKYILGDKEHDEEGLKDKIKNLLQGAEKKRKDAITEFEKEIFE